MKPLIQIVNDHVVVNSPTEGTLTFGRGKAVTVKGFCTETRGLGDAECVLINALLAEFNTVQAEGNTPEQYIRSEIQRLILRAKLAGIVFRVDIESTPPLAMGAHRMVPVVYPVFDEAARERFVAQMKAEKEAAAGANNG